MPLNLNTLGLSKEAIEKRKSSIGGSDANIIMGGDAERINELWAIKRGDSPGPNLRRVLPVQMGSFTEPFNLAWFARETGKTLKDYGATKTVKAGEGFPMTSTLDAATEDAIVEAKHTNPFGGNNMEKMVEKYMPQLQHNMFVTGHKKSYLTVFFGNFKWDFVEVKADSIYQAQLLDAEEAFWKCVENGEMPAAVEVAAPAISKFKPYDFARNNDWVATAVSFKENKAGAKLFEDAKDELKKLIPADASKVTGGGVVATRSKSNAITIKEMK